MNAQIYAEALKTVSPTSKYVLAAYQELYRHIKASHKACAQQTYPLQRDPKANAPALAYLEGQIHGYDHCEWILRRRRTDAVAQIEAALQHSVAVFAPRDFDTDPEIIALRVERVQGVVAAYTDVLERIAR